MDIDIFKIIIVIAFFSKIIAPILNKDKEKNKKNIQNKNHNAYRKKTQDSKDKIYGMEDLIDTIKTHGEKNQNHQKSNRKKSQKPENYDQYVNINAEKIKSKKKSKNSSEGFSLESNSLEGKSLEGYSMNMKPFGTVDPKYKKFDQNDSKEDNIPKPGEISYEDLYKQVYGNTPITAFRDKSPNSKNELRKAIIYSEIIGKPVSMRKYKR